MVEVEGSTPAGRVGRLRFTVRRGVLRPRLWRQHLFLFFVHRREHDGLRAVARRVAGQMNRRVVDAANRRGWRGGAAVASLAVGGDAPNRRGALTARLGLAVSAVGGGTPAVLHFQVNRS